MTEKWRTEICGLLSSEEILIVAIRSGENFSAKHFSVIAFIKKLVTLGCQPAIDGKLDACVTKIFAVVIVFHEYYYKDNESAANMKPDEQKLQELTERIVDAVHPLKIILFGSAARGEMGPNSDLDVLVVMPEGVHRRKTAQLIYRHLVGFRFATDVIVATESDLRRYGDNFSLVFYPVLKEGREIYAI